MGLSRKVLMNAKYNNGRHEKWAATKTFLSGINPVVKDGRKTMPGRLFDCPEFGDVTVNATLFGAINFERVLLSAQTTSLITYFFFTSLVHEA